MSRRGFESVIGSSLLLGALAGCATLPQSRPQRALYSDVRQVVETRERIGWLIDRHEIESATPSVLQSVCQVREEDRFELLEWLERRIDEEGGPAELAYEEVDEDLGEIEELLTLERMRDTLAHADATAARDCPFYLKPDADFSGVQTDTDRFIVVAESFGGLSIIIQDESVLLGGGGALRIIPAYGLGDRVTVGLGFEMGGIGGVSQGESEQVVTARPAGGVPFLFRVHDDTWLYDLELSAITQYADGDVRFPPGIRVAPAVGISSVRITGIMPVALGMVAYEYLPPFKDLPASHAIRFGTRVGVDFDP